MVGIGIGDAIVGDILMALPKYNPSAKCPKCGSKDVGTSYCTETWSSYGHRDIPDNVNEHLDRTCRRCYFKWFEAVKKTKTRPR